MTKKVMAVCGDSYMAATQDRDDRPDLKNSGGKHFSEILSKKLDYELFTLARGACSNTAIRFQIDESIHRKVDFIVIGTTSENRIEYPLNDKKFVWTKGIYNIKYDSHPDLSSLNPNFYDPIIISETINNVLNGYGDARDSIQRKTIEMFFKHLFVPEVRQYQDAWLMSDGIRALRESKIPFLIFTQCWMTQVINTVFYQTNDKRILYKGAGHEKLIPFCYNTLDPEQDNGHTTRRWHVSDKNQVAIADHLCEYIHSNNLLTWS